MFSSIWNWLSNRLRWRPTSVEDLKNAEKEILSYVKQSVNTSFVNIVRSREILQIRTLSMNENAKRTPLVLLHGLGGAVGLWVLNLDAFAQFCPVYAIDVLGFGLSSRPVFNGSAREVEDQLVESIEQWRQQMHLDKFILLGHSMGGFLATSYAIKYPDKVSYLVLADPWGFPEAIGIINVYVSLWRRLYNYIRKYSNPYLALRIAGPLGPSIIRRMRPELLDRFSYVVDDLEVVSNYIYHCNAQFPSGESAFKAMSKGVGWAISPMILRVGEIRDDIPMTFIYASESFISSKPAYKTQKIRTNSTVDVKIISGADHFIHASKPVVFNTIVNEICDKVDEDRGNEVNSLLTEADAN